MAKEYDARRIPVGRCQRVKQHKRLEDPGRFGALQKAESLDPADIIWYEVCGVCGLVTEVEGE